MNYDLIVIGTGAASAAASICRKEGWKVAIIDSRPFGGTCAQRGCDPKKVLVDAARVLHEARRMQGRGIDPAGLKIDWKELMDFKRTFVEDIPQRTEEKYREEGIDAFYGRARFVGERTIEVEGERLSGKKIVIAAGAKPTPLGIEGEELLTTSDRFLELEELPSSLIFVGGGYISFEFAHLAARLGVKVRILNDTSRPLAGFDPDLVDLLVRASHRSGIDIESNAKVIGIEKRGEGLQVHVEMKEGTRTFDAGCVVHGAGRVPAIDDLDLEKGGIRYGKKGIFVNPWLQSVSNPDVYSAGDCAASGGPPLTPVAARETRIAAHNLLHGNSREFNPAAVPSVAFTIPPIAAVGLSEEEAREKEGEVVVRFEETADWYGARHLGETCSAHKIILGREGKKILGAHLVGPHADEVINIFALAIRSGLGVDDLQDVMFAYPTGASDIPYMLP